MTSDSTKRFSLREAHAEDLPVINAYCQEEDMGSYDTPDKIMVAVDAEGALAGFIRIRVAVDGRAFVNPVMSFPSYRRCGVGRMLMAHAKAQYGSLYLVARGKAVGFYKSLGLTEISWGDIIFELCEDCEHCDVRNECKPMPMKW